MIQAGSKMLLALGLVSLICGFTTVCAEAAMGATAASRNNSNRKTSMEGLSCGGQAFNPEVDTCCKVKDGRTNITGGLSEKVSDCCGLKAYNRLNEICCQSTVLDKPAPMAKCCGKEAIDVDTQLCCGKDKTILKRNSSDHQCCGQDQFNTKTHCCCSLKAEDPKIRRIDFSCCKALCGTKPYNDSRQLCCESTVVDKPASNFQCCGKQAFNSDSQLCCGPEDNRKIMTRNSRDHQCCGQNHQFDTNKERCCLVKGVLKIQHICSICVEEPGVGQQKLEPQPNCTESDTNLCGSSCYNPSEFRCCKQLQGKSQRCCAPGRPAAPSVYNPHTHVCWDGCVSERKPSTDQFTGLPGQHCHWTKVCQPHTETCCDGQRHLRKQSIHSCGVNAYNITDPLMKCCAGTLHNLTIGHEAQCCGSILHTTQKVCCSSENMEVLYDAELGFGCCGHLYYNASLWSCCAGKLIPGARPRSEKFRESKLLPLNNLNETDLCGKMQIGTVESVSQDGIMFNSVLKIDGRQAIVEPLASPHILQTPDHCSAPNLVPGRSYFFDEVNVFTDFNHDSILLSLNFIFSMCNPTTS